MTLIRLPCSRGCPPRTQTAVSHRECRPRSISSPSSHRSGPPCGSKPSDRPSGGAFGAALLGLALTASQRPHRRAPTASRVSASASRTRRLAGGGLNHQRASHEHANAPVKQAAASHDPPTATSRASAGEQSRDTPPHESAWQTIVVDDASDAILNNITLLRVIIPTAIAFFGGTALYLPICDLLQNLLDIGNTGEGPILNMLGMDQSQFMQNFLTVNGLLFTILCGNTYTALYNQQERLYHALFTEVSEAKSLLEQSALVCQGRPFYPKVLESIGNYVENDLKQLDAEPAELLANRPMDDPLEYVLYVTSVGVPSVVYDTIRDLRQARSERLGAMQRKLPEVHFVLLYVLGVLELLAFPLLGAGTASMFRERNILVVQAICFGAMCGAIVMTLQVIYELWRPFGGAYTVDVVLGKMVRGLEEELRVRTERWYPAMAVESAVSPAAPVEHSGPAAPVEHSAPQGRSLRSSSGRLIRLLRERIGRQATEWDPAANTQSATDGR